MKNYSKIIKKLESTTEDLQNMSYRLSISDNKSMILLEKYVAELYGTIKELKKELENLKT